MPVKTKSEAQQPAIPAAAGDKMTDTAAVKDGRFPGMVQLFAREGAGGAGAPPGAISGPGGGFGDAPRARLFNGMQGSLGNARIARMLVQTKARQLSDPGDPMEREAEQFASCECHAGVKCSKCEEKVARSAKPGAATARGQVSSEVSGEIDSLSGGQELPGHLRERFEPRLGVDLGGVRVHTDSRAAGLADALDAQAFTAGRDVVFAAGAYDPSSEGGTRLIAHELAHVAQQGAGETLYRQEKQPPAGPPAGPKADESKQKKPEAVKMPDVPANAESVELRGIKLVDDKTYLLGVLRSMFAKEGTYAIIEFISNFRGGLNYAYGRMSEEQLKENAKIPAVAADMEHTRLGKPILATLELAYKDLKTEIDTYVKSFETDARSLALELLKQSEDRVRGEALKYGLREEQIDTILVGPCKNDSCRERTVKKTVHHIAEGGTSKAGLAADAAVLLDHRKTVDDLRRERDKHVYQVPGGPGEHTTWERDDKYWELDKKVTAETSIYNNLHAKYQASYPILGDIGDINKSPDGLVKLATDQEADMASVIGPEIADRLDKIKRTRDGLDPAQKSGDVWALDKIVNMLKAARGLTDGTWELRAVDEKAKAQAAEKFWKEMALTVIGLGFALLAPVTGGASLLVSAGISGYMAYEHLEEYMFQSAAAGTDFSAARAIAAEEPSLIWLALDIIGFVADVGELVGAAAKLAARASKARVIFKAAAPEIGAAQAAGRAIDKGALEAAARAAGADDAMVKKILESAAKNAGDAHAAEKALGATASDVAKLEKAGEVGSELVKTQGTLVHTGNLTVTNAGIIFVCHSPCTMLIEEYSEAIVKSGKQSALEALQQRAAKLGKSAGKQDLFELARDVQRLEDELRSVRTASRAAVFAKLDELVKQFPKLGDLSPAAMERVLAHAPWEGNIKGQLLEEFLNARMAKPENIEKLVPSKVAEQVAKEGGKLEFIPGHAILDAHGDWISDGVIGFWKDDKFHIVTFFESKGGAASGKGLRRAWTGIPRKERAEILKEAQSMGIAAFREVDQNAAEALSEAALQVKKTRPKAKDLSLDEILNKLPDEVEKEWVKLPQGEAGQIRKTTERLSPNKGAGVTKLNIYGKDVDVATATVGAAPGAPKTAGLTPGTPHAVAVLPSDVPEKSLAEAMKEGGITSFERMKDVPVTAKELNDMSAGIAKVSGVPKPAPKPKP